jgi:hypothetical protein
MFGNFLGFPVGSEGSRGGYMADSVHQLQTLDQLSGRPRNLHEASEAKRKRTTAIFLFLPVFNRPLYHVICVTGGS